MLDRRSFLGIIAAAALSPLAFLRSALAATRVPYDAGTFAAATAAGGPVLIDISATWCTTCHRQAAIIGDLVADPRYAGYTIITVDYDTQKDVMRLFGANSRSTLIAFRGPNEVGRVVGDTRPAAIEELLAKAI